ncbi:hypothetical protein A1QO_02795 [Vibrio genomosp. F10 str. ZF-129]|uniref:Uncharacterized protein n=1 Tax=Vibrio genomosp. F10 str. ZF-129 TaxID=1187848 RepID=A0A1E5BKD4_9VIBR|nr:hypothetical protein [Vibrio genomosp. F10]OEE38324.1 hypothetical protein A1QO_02795 [Vibrio genomosp. F10 str. ZF-129]
MNVSNFTIESTQLNKSSIAFGANEDVCWPTGIHSPVIDGVNDGTIWDTPEIAKYNGLKVLEESPSNLVDKAASNVDHCLSREGWWPLNESWNAIYQPSKKLLIKMANEECYNGTCDSMIEARDVMFRLNMEVTSAINLPIYYLLKDGEVVDFMMFTQSAWRTTNGENKGDSLSALYDKQLYIKRGYFIVTVQDENKQCTFMPISLPDNYDGGFVQWKKSDIDSAMLKLKLNSRDTATRLLYNVRTGINSGQFHGKCDHLAWSI